MYTLNLLEQAHEMVLHSVEGLPMIGWHIPGVHGAWSVKDIVAHMTSCEYVLLDIMASVKGSANTPTLNRWLRDRETFEFLEVARRKDKTVPAVLKEYKEVQAETINQIIRFDNETLRKNGTLPWYGEEYDLEQFISYTFYHHKQNLSEQIAAFRDRIAPVVSGELTAWPSR